MFVHPAHTMTFDDLVAGLQAAKAQRHVYERFGPDDLVLYVYSEHCVFDGAWQPVTLAFGVVNPGRFAWFPWVRYGASTFRETPDMQERGVTFAVLSSGCAAR